MRLRPDRSKMLPDFLVFALCSRSVREQIEEARGLRRRAVEETEALLRRATSSLIDEAGWTIRPLGELLMESPRNGLSPKPELENGGRPMLRINAVSSSPTRFVDLTAIKMVEVLDEDAAPF